MVVCQIINKIGLFVSLGLSLMYGEITDINTGHFIESSFPNLEQGYGPEARIYSMKARDETGTIDSPEP